MISTTRRGQPLLVLGSIMLCWMGARVVLWEPMGDAPLTIAGLRIAKAPARAEPRERPVRLAAGADHGRKLAASMPGHHAGVRVGAAAYAGNWPDSADMPRSRWIAPPGLGYAPDGAGFSVMPVRQDAPPPPSAAMPPVPPRVAAGHQLLWLAAVANLPLPDAVLASMAGRREAPDQRAAGGQPSALPRWSGDGWLLLRGGSAGAVAAAAPMPSYGASQMGAVLRYRLAPASRHRPVAYVRGSAALNGFVDREATAGLAANPLAGVPLIAMAELRASQSASGTQLRPAALVVTALPPIPLGWELRAETYAQAGYVGGRGATGFADGQLRIDRALTPRDGTPPSVELRAGGGVWAGAQRGANRLDIGPAATLGIATGSVSARLALDWRFRVAGNAQPASGPALTLSAGF